MNASLAQPRYPHGKSSQHSQMHATTAYQSHSTDIPSEYIYVVHFLAAYGLIRTGTCSPNPFEFNHCWWISPHACCPFHLDFAF
jgi:hypothetical protein